MPVLHLLGTPAERGREHGQLLRRQFKALRESYLEPFLGKEYGEFARVASAFSGFMPADCLEEIQAFAPAAREREEDVLLANTFLDLSRAARCSVAIVAGEASAGGQVLLARNLDFPDLGVAHRATVLKVTHHTEPGLHSFVDVGWPGLVGVLSGMNDSGLCVATLVSFTERGMEPGMPYAMMYRQVLERCTTPQAAVDLVKGAQRTCANSLAVAGPEGEPVVIEFTPTQVAVRRPERGVLVATNDFHKLLPEKQPKVICRRYGDLERLAAGQHGRIDVEFLKEMLRAVAMPAGQSPTLQAMVFEPAARRLHLAVGHRPAPEGAWVTIDCSALFAAK